MYGYMAVPDDQMFTDFSKRKMRLQGGVAGIGIVLALRNQKWKSNDKMESSQLNKDRI